METEDSMPQFEQVDVAAKLHVGISTKLSADLDTFRRRLSEEQIAAYETALKDIKEVKTIEEAQNVLQGLYNRIHDDALSMPDEGNDKKQKVLDAALAIAE